MLFEINFELNLKAEANTIGGNLDWLAMEKFVAFVERLAISSSNFPACSKMHSPVVAFSVCPAGQPRSAMHLPRQPRGPGC